MASIDELITEIKSLTPEQVNEVALLFTELIGSLPDLERPAQPPVENRYDL
jgi:hypothetical protein